MLPLAPTVRAATVARTDQAFATTPGRATTDPARDIPSLDGWRAVAVALVVLAHAATVPHAWDSGVGLRARWMEHPVALGPLGVRIFFVLSGFLITRLLLTEQARTGTIALRWFYVRRTFRIAPALLVYLGVIGLLGATGVFPMEWRNWGLSLVYLSNYVTGNWLTWHTWSLSVEEQFYALWPAALLALRRQRPWALPVAVCLVAPIARVLEWQHYRGEQLWYVGAHFETVADGLAMGVCLAFAARRLDGSRAYARWLDSPAPWVLAPVAGLALALSDPFPMLYFVVGIPVANVAVALLVDWTVRRPTTLLGRALNVGAVRWVGRLSYSIYLWQQLAVANAPDRVPVLGSPAVAPFFTIPGVFVTTLLLAVLSYYGVERPALRARARFERAWRGRRIARTGAVTTATAGA